MEYDLITFIGRFQPPHKAHLAIIRKALSTGKKVLLLVGSAHQPRTIKNPWTWQERQMMIRECFTAEENQNIIVDYIEDCLYNDTKWARNIQANVSQHTDVQSKVAIIGHQKDESSYYLTKFPQWELIEMDNIDGLNSTDIRKLMFFDNKHNVSSEIREMLDPTTVDAMQQFINSQPYLDLLDEAEFYEVHDKMWETAPYPPTFVCTDAVVIQAGHVLLIQRKNCPGKNTWALPGGYVEQHESLLQSSIRELKEETKLKVPIPVLHGSNFAHRVFDHPQRSLRGRIITHAYGFHLQKLDHTESLQEVRGSDDAAKACWIPIHEVKREDMFEDHYDIIQTMVDCINTREI